MLYYIYRTALLYNKFAKALQATAYIKKMIKLPLKITLKLLKIKITS